MVSRVIACDQAADQISQNREALEQLAERRRRRPAQLPAVPERDIHVASDARPRAPGWLAEHLRLRSVMGITDHERDSHVEERVLERGERARLHDLDEL